MLKKDFNDAWICAECGEPVENGYRCQCGYVYRSIDYAIPDEIKDGE